jgi:hypothetical protein
LLLAALVVAWGITTMVAVVVAVPEVIEPLPGFP